MSARTIFYLLALLTLLLLSGCVADNLQSTVHPASDEAEKIARLWWFLLIVCTAVFVIVMGLLAFGIFRRPSKERSSAPGGPTRFIIIGGVALPAVVLVGIQIYSLAVTVALRLPDDGLTIRVAGHQWWWEVYYPEEDITTANEIYIPVGEPVRLDLRAADVAHSFWVPNLHGKMDLLPEHSNWSWLHARQPGTWRGQCAEFCGVQHALMALKVVALPREEFDTWVAERQRRVPEPETPLLQHGKEVFFSAACHNCHAIRDTEATARVGPDLTHIGSRLTLGAATLPNTYGTLAGWIVNPQALKPGNEMPNTFIRAEDLHALVSYLQSLE